MVSIEKLKGRDILNHSKISNKINEIISFLEENEMLSKSEYDNIVRMRETK